MLAIVENRAVDIPLIQMALLFLFLAIPLFLMWRLRVSLRKKLLISTARMAIQLTLVGLYLGYLFKLNNIFVNILWLAVMIFVASAHIIKSAHLRQRELFTSVFYALILAMLVVLVPFVTGIIRPEKFYDARYMIPLGGMLLGNSLSANIVALNHYVSSLKEQKQSIQTAFCFGATRYEATLPFLRQAFNRAITPTVTTIGTLGLVSLPGMMTGQMLGGSVPTVAIKYQIAIMIAIVTACSLSIFLTLLFITRRIFDQRDNIRLDMFKDNNQN
ncbi:MAG: ABC transporter permease [Phycisphaerae bacterium]|nr:ABC transporter permease [Phycisphaerae bacterium]